MKVHVSLDNDGGVIYHYVAQQLMVVFSLFFIVIEWHLSKPNLDHLIKFISANLILFDDFAHSWHNIVFAMSIDLGFFWSLGNLEGFNESLDAFFGISVESLGGLFRQDSNTVSGGLSDWKSFVTGVSEKSLQKVGPNIRNEFDTQELDHVIDDKNGKFVHLLRLIFL